MKMKNTKLNSFKNILSALLIVCCFCYLLLNWQNLPDQIPGHYNAAGEIDRWANKSEFLLLPVLTLVFYLFISFIERFPQCWNTGVTVTEQNERQVYTTLKGMIVTAKLITVSVFCYLCVMQLTATPLHPSFLPIFLVLEFGSLIYYVVKLIKLKR